MTWVTIAMMIFQHQLITICEYSPGLEVCVRLSQDKVALNATGLVMLVKAWILLLQLYKYFHYYYLVRLVKAWIAESKLGQHCGAPFQLFCSRVNGVEHHWAK